MLEFKRFDWREVSFGKQRRFRLKIRQVVYRERPNIAESFFEENSAILGTFGVISTFSDMAIEIIFFVQIRTRGMKS